MKNKFVEVWDDYRCGYIKYIVLQVEDSDEFLLKAGFDSGYKFIVQAHRRRVGAVGVGDFDPYDDRRARDKSWKLNETEADVLYFYLQNVENIYEIPDKLFTEKIWKVVRTDGYGVIDEEYDVNNCYKVLLSYSFDCDKIDKCIIIDKDTLEIVTYSKIVGDDELMIARYLWNPCDELPEELWESVLKENEENLEYMFSNIYDLSEK